MSRERAAQLIDAGIWLKLSGDIEGARRLFERALKLDPDNEKAHKLLAAPGVPESKPSSVTAAENPFERPADADWGAQVAFDVPVLASPPVPPVAPVSPAPAPVDLNGDWGRATGSSPSPAPQVPPVIPSPVPQVPAVTPTIRTGRTAMMFADGVDTLASAPSPKPFFEEAPAQPPHRATLPFAASPSQAPLQSAPSRQTMVYAGTPPPPAPIPPPQGPGPSGTLMFSSSDSTPSGQSLADVTPSRMTLPFDLSAPNRNTITSVSAPRASPSSVQPMVVRLEESDEPVDDAEDPVVEMLRQQVEAAKARPRHWEPPTDGTVPQPPPSAPDPLFPSTVVLVDRTPDPSPPRATPPMFTEEPIRTLHPTESPPAQKDAWNWNSAGQSAAPSFEFAEAPRPSPLVPQASSAWDQRSNPGIKMDDIVVPDRTMEFVSSNSKAPRSAEAKREEIAMLLRGARDLIDLDDHTGAMELIGKAQAIAPDDPDVQQLRERSERTLLAMFESKLGHLDKIPRVMLKDDEIIWLNLDHRAGFVLAQIDGSMTFEDLFAVSGMSRLDTARILAQLVDEGVISRA